MESMINWLYQDSGTSMAPTTTTITTITNKTAYKYTK